MSKFAIQKGEVPVPCIDVALSGECCGFNAQHTIHF